MKTENWLERLVRALFGTRPTESAGRNGGRRLRLDSPRIEQEQTPTKAPISPVRPNPNSTNSGHAVPPPPPRPATWQVPQQTDNRPLPRVEWSPTPTTSVLQSMPSRAAPPSFQNAPYVVKPSVVAPSPRTGIEWATPRSGIPAPSTLLGIEDAYEHTPLLPGEDIAFCTRDQVAFHLSTYEFLKAQNQDRCCVCGLPGTFKFITLPGALLPPLKAYAPREVDLFDLGEKIIQLPQVHDYVGCAVVVAAFVYEVYCSKNTSTYFVRFEPRHEGHPVFAGFKVVIFPKYYSEWVKVGLDPYEYEGCYVRVKGLIQEHPVWGIEILVNSPRVIQVLDDSKPRNQ